MSDQGPPAEELEGAPISVVEVMLRDDTVLVDVDQYVLVDPFINIGAHVTDGVSVEPDAADIARMWKAINDYLADALPADKAATPLAFTSAWQDVMADHGVPTSKVFDGLAATQSHWGDALSRKVLVSGDYASWLGGWADEHGYPAHGTAERTAPAPAKPELTHGQAAVKDVAIRVGTASVTAPGLTTPEAEAISKAIGVSYSDTLKVQAAVIDKMLPGMHPGQVPQALSQLNRAVTILEHQMVTVANRVAGRAPASVTKGLATAMTEVKALSTAVDKLVAQVDLTEPSALDTHVNKIGDQVATNTADIHKVEMAIPDLATGAGLAVVAGQVTKLISQVDLSEPSALDSHLNAVGKTATEAQTAADKAQEAADTAQDCCAEATGALGGKSGLSSLGSLLGKVVGLTFLAGLLDPVLAVFDMPAVVKATVWETTKVAGYAEQAAKVVMADFSWEGGWSNGS